MKPFGQRTIAAAILMIVLFASISVGGVSEAATSPDDASDQSTDEISQALKPVEPAGERRAAADAAADAVLGGSLGFYMESPEKDTVYVGLDPAKNNPAEHARVSAELAAVAKVEPERFTFITYLGSTDDTTIWGGDGLGTCSAGAWGYSWYGSLQVPIQVSAGHCADVARHVTGGSHAPDYITRSQWVAGSVDAQAMTPDAMLGEYTTNVRGTGHIINVVTAGGPFDRVGDPVCKSGRLTGFTCGAIWSTNGGCGPHTGMRLAGYNRAGGDSGGTVVTGTFPNVGLAGIHSGGCEIDLGGGPFVLARYGFQANAAYILGLAGWYTS